MQNRRFMIVILLLFTLTILSSVIGGESALTGVIRGKVFDVETQAPLLGVNVIVRNSLLGAATDPEGNFIINKVPVGNYTLQFQYIGYEKLNKTDIIVRSDRVTLVHVEMKTSPLEMDQIVVTSGYFQLDEQPASSVQFSFEEIRRAPGSAGDVSRIIMTLPSIAKVNDQTNNLVVRGGSPMENAFFIDNIEIPNINHFPTQGASGGPLGLLNVDFIREVDFHAGGFSSLYGDRLSSVMAIRFREGNRHELDGQVDLNFAGIGCTAEGPLFSQKGSWLISARRSYLDFLVHLVDIGSTMPPTYGDFQGKIIWDINRNHQLTMLEVWGNDINNPDRKTAIENDMIYYGDQNIIENTTGLNWRALWNEKGYSNTSLSYTLTRFHENFRETNSDIPLILNRSSEHGIKLRNVNHIRLHARHSLEFGVEAKHLIADYDNRYAEYTDALGQLVKTLTLDERVAANKVGCFLNYTIEPWRRLSAQLGFRADYFSLNENHTFSPRFSLSYSLSNRTSLKLATGLYAQNLPLILLAQNKDHRRLRDPLATHYVIGIDHLITENTKLSFEVYRKDYRHFPVNPKQPSLFLIDELYYRYGFFFNHEQLIDNGRAYSTGMELMVQKKLAKNIYGLVSASCFRTKYRGQGDKWIDRVYDNRWILSAEGGYKPNHRWEFSLRWIYAGGAPYTPFDIGKSCELDRAVLDENRINKARYPDYHSLNLRFDRRFHFAHSNLIFYISIWNAYDRKNIATYFWNGNEDKQDVIYQWRVIPLFGLEFEF